MAESSLAIAFTELGEGMKTLSVDGPTLWETGEAKIVPDDDEDAVRLVSCGREFPEHKVARLRRPTTRRASARSPEGTRRRDPHRRARA